MAVGRRRVTAAGLGAFAILPLLARVAAAAPDFPPLHRPAIALKNPAGVFLIGLAMAGGRLVAVGAHGAIVYSDDDGQSWRQAAVPVSVTLTCVGFATPSIGWAAGDYGIVLHTADGGESWQVQLDGLQVNALMLRAAQDLATAQPDNPGAARALRRAGIFGAAGPDKPFLALWPVSATRATVFGAYRMAVETQDGGQSWVDASLRLTDPLSHNIYGVSATPGAVFLAEETGLVLCSTDAGASFALLGQPAQATLFGVLALPGGTVLAYGVAGTLVRSTDLGATWNSLAIGTAGNLTAAMALRDGSVVITGQRGTVFRSHDGGASFQPLTAQLGMELYAVAQAPDGALIFAGDGGVRRLPLSGEV